MPYEEINFCLFFLFIIIIVIIIIIIIIIPLQFFPHAFADGLSLGFEW